MNTDAIQEACARAAHEVNRAYCLALGDTSQVPWDEAPEWQRTTCINGVRGVIEGNGPEKSHETWCAEKVAAGWVHGEEKDPEKKTHPCLVAYGELPTEQREKEALFVITVQRVSDSLEAAFVTVRARIMAIPLTDLEDDRLIWAWREQSVMRRLVSRRLNRRKIQHRRELTTLNMAATIVAANYEEAAEAAETSAHAAVGLPSFTIKEMTG